MVLCIGLLCIVSYLALNLSTSVESTNISTTIIDFLHFIKLVPPSTSIDCFDEKPLNFFKDLMLNGVIAHVLGSQKHVSHKDWGRTVEVSAQYYLYLNYKIQNNKSSKNSHVFLNIELYIYC